MSDLSECRRCPRLAAHLAQVKATHPTYYAKPVLPFGAAEAELLIVGLAPGMHGANATGRPFTGDYAGILLYQTLYDFGFSNQPEVRGRDDGLVLQRCRITNAVKCLPPDNKPSTAEIKTCNPYLRGELNAQQPGSVIIALGGIAHQAVLRASDLKLSGHPFGHGAEYSLPGAKVLLDSYHCSRYNTQTRRLTAAMFQAIFARTQELLER